MVRLGTWQRCAGAGLYQLAKAEWAHISQLCIQQHQVGNLKLPVGIFTPGKSVNATSKGTLPPKLLVVKHLLPHHWELVH